MYAGTPTNPEIKIAIHKMVSQIARESGSWVCSVSFSTNTATKLYSTLEMRAYKKSALYDPKYLYGCRIVLDNTVPDDTISVKHELVD